jgi:glutathione S-transferase
MKRLLSLTGFGLIFWYFSGLLSSMEHSVMKLYYWPGACSLSPHIVSREAEIELQLAQLDRAERKTQDGTVLSSVNPKNQVPVLELDNGQRLTEGPVIVQYLADQKPSSGLVPPPGTMERYRVQEWLNFITSELHKTFGPMFRPTTPDEFKKISREYLAQRFEWIDEQLAGKQYLMGEIFTVADAYMFTVLRWSPRVGIDLSKWPNIKAYLDRVEARPKVKEAMQAEGLLQ